jgi:hypothetical protein
MIEPGLGGVVFDVMNAAWSAVRGKKVDGAHNVAGIRVPACIPEIATDACMPPLRMMNFRGFPPRSEARADRIMDTRLSALPPCADDD